jgi:hypothetical protein
LPLAKLPLDADFPLSSLKKKRKKKKKKKRAVFDCLVCEQNNNTFLSRGQGQAHVLGVHSSRPSQQKALSDYLPSREVPPPQNRVEIGKSTVGIPPTPYTHQDHR